MSEDENPLEGLGGVDDQKAIEAAPAQLSDIQQEKQKAADELSKSKDGGELSMHLLIYSPYKTYFEGPAFSLTAESESGQFDILPRHHNFISLLVACELVIRTADKQGRKILISGGVIHVKADEVVVFLDV